MDEEIILKLTCDQCIEKLKEIGQHRPGTLEELKMRLSLENLVGIQNLIKDLNLKHNESISFNVVLIQMKCLVFLQNGV